MTHTKAPRSTDDVLQPIDLRVEKIQSAWREEAKALAKLATAFGPLTKPQVYQDLTKLPALLKKVETKIRSLEVADRGLAALKDIRGSLVDRKQRMQDRLAKDLKSKCEESGLGFRVISRDEPVEIRIPPFAVQIDRKKGTAVLRFAHQPIATCEADAAAILKTHDQTLKNMRKGFRAESFFDACFKAWRAACGAGSGGTGERVEILDFLPYLAMQLQPAAFRVEPSERNFRGYSRARFAFDMQSLRNEGSLSRGGWRMNLGVATGTTATKKNRAIFFEDATGDGEFKLTVFFTRAEAK